MHSLQILFVAFTAANLLVHGQSTSTSPHDYGQPSGDFSPEWQNYYEVKEPLPNVTFSLPRNWAGNINVNRSGHPNDTIFFWAFEKENRSLTAEVDERDDEPWGIWLNGGGTPGSSTILGLMIENGPIHLSSDYSLHANKYSWDRLADYVCVDQPVGVGFGTVDAGDFGKFEFKRLQLPSLMTLVTYVGPVTVVADEDQMGIDFFGFLTNLVKVFPSLKTRPLYITGESYAGKYIPYIAKAYFGMAEHPVKLAKIAIGDGTIGKDIVFNIVPTVTVIETYSQLMGYDNEVYAYFRKQNHICGYDLNLTYPQTNGKFPTLNLTIPSIRPSSNATSTSSSPLLDSYTLMSDSDISFVRHLARYTTEVHRKRSTYRDSAVEQWKLERASSPIDPCLPWKGSDSGGFDVNNVPDALDPEPILDASVFLSDNRTRRALHAPTSNDWQANIRYNFSGPNGQDPSVEPMAFLDELALNATKNNVGVVIYSGNDDALVAHTGSQVVIQNTTFGGIQGFTRCPSTPWFDDNGDFAGIVHQERNWTYVLVAGAGHLVPQQQPQRVFVLLREFILGTFNDTAGSHVGEEALPLLLADGVIPGQNDIYTGSGTTQGTYTYPRETIEAWSKLHWETRRDGY